MADLKFEIEEHLITLSENAKGWTKELNRVSWNGMEAKYDLRQWSPDHEKMVLLSMHVNHDNHSDVKSKSDHKSNAPKKFKETFIFEVFKVEQIQ